MKITIISGLLIALFAIAHIIATTQRGYVAWGGELSFLMAIPLAMSIMGGKS